ncbi:hypothetical protein [Pseudorhizobium marinum]|uniref:hypothetical protein n=1 Tax=Pseudorhizobium marinum TaxID=1496690 RepID=UPI0004956F4E|nr:hypothetical protein [Pseudorhizobium marinum]
MIGEGFFRLFFFLVLFCASTASYVVYVRNALKAKALGVKVHGMHYVFVDIRDPRCTREIRNTYYWSRLFLCVFTTLMVLYLIMI